MKIARYRQSWRLSALLAGAAFMLTACGGTGIETDNPSEGIQSSASVSSVSSSTISSSSSQVQVSSSSVKVSSASSSTPVVNSSVSSAKSSVASSVKSSTASNVVSSAKSSAASSVASSSKSSAASSVVSSAKSSTASSSSVDTTAPVAPKGLQQVSISTSEVSISWLTATDNVGVVAYRIYRNGTQIGQVNKSVLQYRDTGLDSGVDYVYTIRAGDAAGNWSTTSSTLRLKTLEQPSPTTLVIEWTAPDERENGDYLELDELGGYEIRYKLASETTYTSIRIPDATATSYSLNALSGTYEFEIAAFDSDGLYSQFVPVNPL